MVCLQVYFLDSLKYYLSLYGHKNLVLCMDISSDGELIVTGSADKNMKIWGLDFGDCHKSIFAHANRSLDITFILKNFFFLAIKCKLKPCCNPFLFWLQCYGCEVCS